jgi:hypothetical protein
MTGDHTPQATLIGTRAHTLRSRFYDVEHQIFVFLPPRYEEQAGAAGLPMSRISSPPISIVT